MKRKLIKRNKKFLTWFNKKICRGWPMWMVLSDHYGKQAIREEKHFAKIIKYSYTKKGRLDGTYSQVHWSTPKQYCHGKEGKIVNKILQEEVLTEWINDFHAWWSTHPLKDYTGEEGQVQYIMYKDDDDHVVDGAHGNCDSIEVYIRRGKYNNMLVLILCKYYAQIIINPNHGSEVRSINVQFPNDLKGIEEEAFQISLIQDLYILSNDALTQLLQIASTLHTNGRYLCRE